MRVKGGQWKWWIGGAVVALVLAGTLAGWRTIQARPLWGGHGGGMMMGLGGLLHDLDLTADQKKQMAGILRTHKSELLQARDKMSQAGRAVMEGLADQDARPEALQARVDAAAEAGKQLARVWIGVRRDALAILSPQQKQDLAKHQQRFLQRMESRLHENQQDREHDLDEWIERLSR
jgi:Spy/CpxP family protein refolding chaperone